MVERLFAGEEVTHTGRNYQLDRFRSYPDPVQRPVPIMIGASGRRMVTMAAERAAIISLIVRSGQSVDRQRAFEQQLQWIADAGGRERADLIVGVRVFFGEVGAPGEPRRAVAERVAAASKMEVDDVLTSPFGIAGDPVAARDHLQEVSERYGISYFTMNEDLAWNAGPVITSLADA